MGYHLIVMDENGKEYPVSQVGGLGVQQHKDVMLALGHSRTTSIEITIPIGRFAIIKSVIPVGLNHHTEARTLESKSAAIRFRIYNDVLDANFPVKVSDMPILQERGAYLIPNTGGTLYTFHGVVVANPIVSGSLIGNYPMYTNDPQGNTPSMPQRDSLVEGRYYNPSTYAIVIENIGLRDTTIYYRYSWHEFE